MASQDPVKEDGFLRLFCDVCEARKNDATSRCNECDNFLCVVCKSAHLSFKVLRHHTIVDLRAGIQRSTDRVVRVSVPSATPTDTGSMQGNGCMQHLSELLQFFCETCHRAICCDCTVDHQKPDHKCVDLKDAIEHKREALLMTIQSFQQAESQLDTALNQLSQLNRRIESTTQATEAEVNRAADHALIVSQKRIEEKRQRHLQDAITLGVQRKNNVSDHRDTLLHTLGCFRQAQNLAAKIVKNGSDQEVLVSSDALTASLHQQIKSLDSWCGLNTKNHLDNFAFTSDRHDPIQSLHRAFGVGPLGHLTGEWVVHREIGFELSNAGALAVSRWGEVVVVENKRRIAQLFDQTGKCRLAFTTVDDIIKETRVGVDKILGFIRAVVFSKAGHIIICDCSIFVKVFSGQGRYLCAFKTTAVGDNCSNPVLLCCLAVDDSNRIYVGDSNRRCVTIHKPNGCRIQLIECTRPAQLAVAGQYLVVLPADPTDSIKLLDRTGNTQRALAVPDTLRPWLPVSVACSAENKKIFVANAHKDGDRAVHEFNMEGDYQGCLTRNLSQPAGISWSRSQDGEELLIADDKSVKVLRKI